ncbi:MAG: flavodoxin family protein [Candidatus Bathyarchaeia archaeon]
MYVVGISGSPRKEGNTAILVREVLKHLKGEKRFISLSGLNINPCDSCDMCWKENVECVIDDDIRWIIREMEKADVIILGSPCYWGMVSAQLKMLIDRTVSIYEKGTLKNKIGAVVVTHDVHGQAGYMTALLIANFLSANGILYAGRVIGEGGAEMGHIKKDKRAMRGAKELAERIMELYELTKRR